MRAETIIQMFVDIIRLKLSDMLIFAISEYETLSPKNLLFSLMLSKTVISALTEQPITAMIMAKIFSSSGMLKKITETEA